MTQIVEVVLQTLQHFLHRVGIAIVQSCIRSDTRPYLVEVCVTLIVLQNLVNIELSLWTRAHKRHIALEDIVQLRKLIEVMSANKLSHTSQTGIVSATRLAQLRSHLLGIHSHRAELIDVEWSAETAYTLLFEDWISAKIGRAHV